MMAMELNPHPLKTEIKDAGMRLWQLRAKLGGSPSEGKISRILNGIEVMPEKLEERIKTILQETH